jgi:cation-transporting ATPase E
MRRQQRTIGDILGGVTSLAYLRMTGDVDVARSALTTATVFCGLVLIPYVELPTKWWVAGDTLSGDCRPTLMAVALLSFYGIIVAVPPLRAFFELTPLRVLDYTLIGVGVVAWALLLRLVWRMRLFERLLSYQGLSAKPDTFHGDA